MKRLPALTGGTVERWHLQFPLYCNSSQVAIYLPHTYWYLIVGCVSGACKSIQRFFQSYYSTTYVFVYVIQSCILHDCMLTIPIYGFGLLAFMAVFKVNGLLFVRYVPKFHDSR